MGTEDEGFCGLRAVGGSKKIIFVDFGAFVASETVCDDRILKVRYGFPINATGRCVVVDDICLLDIMIYVFLFHKCVSLSPSRSP